MQKYYLFDGQGYFITVVEREEQPENSTSITPPAEKYKLRFDGQKWIEERPDPQNGKGWNSETKEWDLEPSNQCPLEIKLVELSAACKTAIHSGIELGGKRYALTTEDQINIQNLALQIQAGATAALYHADGELCEPYSAEAIMALMEAAVRHVTYHTTYCNHLNIWVRRVELDELDGIYYGAPLPEDLQEHLNALLAAMGGVT